MTGRRDLVAVCLVVVCVAFCKATTATRGTRTGTHVRQVRSSRFSPDSTASSPERLSGERLLPELDPEPQDEEYDVDEDKILIKQNPCLVQFCGVGRECRVVGGEAQCDCIGRCPNRAQPVPVCGLDRHMYQSLCELHRAACLQNRDIGVDHSFACSSDQTPHAGNEEVSDDTPATLSNARTAGQPPAVPTEITTSVPPTTLSTTTIDVPRHGDIHGDDESDDPDDEEDDEDDDSDDKSIDNEAGVDENEEEVRLNKECTSAKYDTMQNDLLVYTQKKSDSRWLQSKQSILRRMFILFDKDQSGELETSELDLVAHTENFNIPRGCRLSDLVRRGDLNADRRLSSREFVRAFSKSRVVYPLSGVSVVSLDKALELIRLTARVGDNVEMKCDVTGSPPPPIQWHRNGADLSTGSPDDDVRIFSDGSLYLTRIQLVHAGNYSCRAARNPEVVQTHILAVHTEPEVRVTPKIQSRRPGEDASMFCHVIGEPFPKVDWLKNNEHLRADSRKFKMVGNGTELRVLNLDFADTGAYMCQAESVGGITRAISSLVVLAVPPPTAAPNEERRFFAFHDGGVSVYEPSACRLYHQIQSSDVIPGTQEYVCGDKHVNCSWGDAINVANRYVYVSQPRKDRVLVISKIQMVVVDVVATDRYPVQLHYVPHLDQVWVLNWRSEEDEGVKTIQVIRDASQKRKHHTVHPEPIDGHFDLVRGLFMPPDQDLSHRFKYAYVTHLDQRGLYKLDLTNMRYVRSIDLTPNNCVPRHLQFSALYGLVVIECEEPVTKRSQGQLLLDYLTDSVVVHSPGLLGRPHVAPDSRTVVTLDRDRDGATLVVQEITERGLRFAFDVKTTLNISDMTFYPSRTTHSYDLYASTSNKEDILFLNLSSGKVEVITGVGRAMEPSLAQWGRPNRPIAASGVFGHFMVTPASEALFVINGETRTVNCEIGELAHPRTVVWVTMQLQ